MPRATPPAFYAYLGDQFRQINQRDSAGGLPAHILYGDINGDGLQDGVMYRGTPGRSSCICNTRTTTSPIVPPDYQIQVGAASSIALADINGDGRLDILVTDQVSGEVRVLL